MCKLARNHGALLAILFLGTFLRVYQLGTESLWRDEGWTTWFASLGSPSEIVEQSKTDNNFPTYYLILRYWIGLFGDSEFSVRFPSALVGVLAVFAIYKVGQLLFGRSTGLIASLLLMLSPFHIAYSQEARVYSFMTLLAVLSFYFFLEVLAKPNAAARTGYVLSTTALLYCHVYGLFIVLAQNIYFFATAFLGKASGSRDGTRFGRVGLASSPPPRSLCASIYLTGRLDFQSHRPGVDNATIAELDILRFHSLLWLSLAPDSATDFLPARGDRATKEWRR